MERFLVLVFAAVAMLNSEAASAQDETRTVGDVFFERYNETIEYSLYQYLRKYQHDLIVWTLSKYVPFYGIEPELPLKSEINRYLLNLEYEILSAFAADLSTTTLQFIYKDLNDNCGEFLEMSIVDLTVEPSNVTCVSIRLRFMLRLMLRRDIGVGLQKLRTLCVLQLVPLCDKVHPHCTMDYEGRVGKLLRNYVEDAREVAAERATTPLEIIYVFMGESFNWVTRTYSVGYNGLTLTAYYLSSLPSTIEPFTLENIIGPRSNAVESAFFRNKTLIRSRDESTWGIVKTNAGSVGFPCSEYRDTYSQDSEEYLTFLRKCYKVKAYTSILELIGCVYSNRTSRPLTWSTVTSAYFHSHCLCFAYNGIDCGVTPPLGVDPRLYCLSVLLKDFQRQASYRPAITYLDYSSQTRLPVCQFSNMLQLDIRKLCDNFSQTEKFPFLLSVQCYFNGLVNKHLNCLESPIVNTYNETVLCGLLFFMDFVVCDGDNDVEVPVTYYRAGDSPLVLFLTYGDVVVRVFTAVTYLACPQLRNLPGKLLIAYLVTTLLRLVVVRATLADMEVAVRLDVATDVSSTLWLTSYLHFLTVSIRDLRPPDSLSPDEVRMVLIRYSLLGWALPVALSTAFFWMDEAINRYVQIGQMLFLLCNYVALFANLYMFLKNCSFYYDVKKSASEIKPGSRKRDVFAAIFNFAIKTSVLSGVGITIRLAFTQIQGLEQFLGYYHALGSLQGFLVFLLYGCNHEACDFWLQVVHSTLSRFRRRQNASVETIYFQLIK